MATFLIEVSGLGFPASLWRLFRFGRLISRNCMGSYYDVSCCGQSGSRLNMHSPPPADKTLK
eukprot:3162911-Amphidinium_carterae.1